ncbi:MAG: lanthionine synthetase LanC family protein, partial [Actinomycetes bacterium]
TWCYGDPGIALALSVVSRATGSATIAAAAAEITANALARPPDEAGVQDATICHGAAGLIWFGHRISTQSGRTRTGDPAARRFTRTWVCHVAEQRAAGPLRYVRPDGTARHHSFLEGDIGVALALHFVATGATPAWEQLLLGCRIEPPTV